MVQKIARALVLVGLGALLSTAVVACGGGGSAPADTAAPEATATP